MDHGWPLRPVEHNKLEKPCGSIWSEDQPPQGIVVDLLEHHGVLQRVQDVVDLETVP